MIHELRQLIWLSIALLTASLLLDLLSLCAN
jgi:hypothetical protein